MKRVILFLSLLLVAVASPTHSLHSNASGNLPPAPAVVRLDPRLDQIVAADAAVEKIADGYADHHAGRSKFALHSKTVRHESGKLKQVTFSMAMH